MFGWLFGKSQVWYKDGEMLIIRYRSCEGYFYIGSIDTQEGFLETKHTLGAVGRALESTALFRNNFLTMFERLGFGLKALGHDPVRTVSDRGMWFFDYAPSTLFVASLPPSRSAYQIRSCGQFARSKRANDKAVLEAVLDRVSQYRLTRNNHD